MPECVPAARAELLLAAAAEVLETMFFDELRAAPDVPPLDAELMAARIRFRGAPSGTFRLWIQPAAAARLAAGFLALEDDAQARERAGEVALELANIVCGSVLSRLEADAAFTLDAPEVSGEPPGADAVWALLGADEFLGLALSLEATP